MIKSHARAWHIYDDIYRATQNGIKLHLYSVAELTGLTILGEVGITLDSGWIEPKTQSLQDIEAAERAMQFKVFLQLLFKLY